MAQKVVVELIDDLDGTPFPAGKGESIDFAVDGVGYRIDLGPKNAKAFRKTFDTYLTHATRIGGRRQRRTHTPTDHPRRDPAQTLIPAAIEQAQPRPDNPRPYASVHTTFLYEAIDDPDLEADRQLRHRVASHVRVRQGPALEAARTLVAAPLVSTVSGSSESMNTSGNTFGDRPIRVS